MIITLLFSCIISLIFVYVYELVHMDDIFDDRICYMKKSGVRIIIQFSELNCKITLPQ